MYQTIKTYITSDMIMSDLISENHFLLIMMEHFGVDFVTENKTIHDICSEHTINENIFIAFCNLYNGFRNDFTIEANSDTIRQIIRFLKNSHIYYKDEKFPEIHNYIQSLYQNNDNREVKMIEQFFIDYHDEVMEHLQYEDDTAFPYFNSLLEQDANRKIHSESFSVMEYREHHDDIESKLSDLKNLLLKHLQFKKDVSLRRKLLFSLFELEFDLTIHASIEELILVPMVEQIEKE
jgi:regulator of cell morphogenesis and NO signaling